MVSVIILSYNTKDLTLRCLDCLDKSRGVDLETIVVDNGSKDGTVAEIRKNKRYQEIKIIENKENLGFGAANNQGMKIAAGDYFLLLNSDCFVEPETISGLVQALTIMPDTDVAGCKLQNPDKTLQPSYGFFPTLGRIAALMLFTDNLPVIRRYFPSIHIRDADRYRRVVEVDWVMGALILLKREVWEKTGGFDEKYFMYGEEVEWQYRMRKAGFVVKFIPQVTAVHIGGASSPTKAPALIGEIDSWKYWIHKYHPGWQERVLPVIVAIGCLLRMWLKPQYRKFYEQALRRIATVASAPSR